jgi:acetyl esterase/lipase
MTKAIQKQAIQKTDIPATAGDITIVDKMLRDVKFAKSYQASGDIDALRAATAKMISNPFFRPEPAGVTVTQATLGGVAGEWITPEGCNTGPVLVFFHGGGYIRGSLDLGRANASEIALGTGCRVFAAGYAQAPERPFPAAFDDAVAVARTIGAAHRDYALVGESCGGGMVLAAAMALRDEGEKAGDPTPLPFAVACISPFVDLTLSGDSWDFNQGQDIATRQMGADMIALYLGQSDPKDWRASPMFGQFDGLPPLHMIVGRSEGLLSEALAVADNAARAGVSVTLDLHERMPHGFTKYRFDAATLAIARVSEWLTSQARDAVARDPSKGAERQGAIK